MFSYDTATTQNAGVGAGLDLLRITNTQPGTSQTYGYGYDAAHRLSSQSVSPIAALIHPAPANTLAGLTATADNRVLNPAAGGTLSYGATDDLSSDTARSYTYDVEGGRRMLTATKGSTMASYQYDPFGRRIDKTVGSITTQFLIDRDGQEVAEYNGSGNLYRRLLRVPGLTAPIATADVSGNLTFYQQDRLGSVVAVLPPSGPATTYAYLPYGDTANGSISGTSWGYAGYRWDSETQTYHTATRAYDPRLGRFLQTDPSGQNAGSNVYAYTGGDPLNATDPSGMNWVNDGGTYGAGYNSNTGGGACGCEGNPEHETMQNYMNQQIAYDSSSSGLLPQPVLVENLPPPPGMAPALNPNQLAFLAPAAGVAADVGLGILAAPAAGLGALLYPNSTAANDTCAGGGCIDSNDTYVVKGGLATIPNIQGSVGFNQSIGKYGFSVQSAPGQSLLAAR